MPRFAGRAVNFAGWVLRNLGAAAEAHDHHLEALELAARHGAPPRSPSPRWRTWPRHAWTPATPTAPRRGWPRPARCCSGDLVFGWRLELKHQLITGRLALLRGEPDRALAAAADLESRAAALGVPRYTSVARLLRHRACHALGMPVDLDAVAADLDLIDRSVALEAWWWTGDAAADFAVTAWHDRALAAAGRLASQAGPHAGRLLRAAQQRRYGLPAAAG